MHQSGQLAAIMFTDIVGYTALMGDDEQKAFDVLGITPGWSLLMETLHYNENNIYLSSLFLKVNLQKITNMAQALDQEMHNYFTQLKEAEKRSIILMLKTFLQTRKENAERISIEQYNKEIEEAEAEFERGDYITNEEMLRQIRRW